MRRVIAWLCLAAWLGQAPMTVWADIQTASPRGTALGLPADTRDRFITALAAMKSGDWSRAATALGERDWAATPLADYAALLQAESLLQAGAPDAARAAALRAAHDTPESQLAPSALLRAATVLSSGGDSGNAMLLWRRFLARHGDHSSVTRARLGLAQALLAEGRTQEAAKAFTEVWLRSPASPEAEDAARQLRTMGET